MTHITLGSTWKYIGNSSGRGETHTVVALGKEIISEFQPPVDRVITIGVSSGGQVGHSFFGEPGQFYLEFTPVTQEP